MTRSNIERIVAVYRLHGKIDVCAKACNVPWETAHKVLVTSGEYSTPLSRKILEMHEDGYNAADIAAALGVNKHKVWRYLPYSKGPYNSDSPSENAIALRKSRARKKGKAAAETGKEE